jgi:hypothetical protein
MVINIASVAVELAQYISALVCFKFSRVKNNETDIRSIAWEDNGISVKRICGAFNWFGCTSKKAIRPTQVAMIRISFTCSNGTDFEKFFDWECHFSIPSSSFMPC